MAGSVIPVIPRMAAAGMTLATAIAEAATAAVVVTEAAMAEGIDVV